MTTEPVGKQPAGFVMSKAGPFSAAALPAHDLRAGRWKSLVVSLFLKLRVELTEWARLVVLEEYRQENGVVRGPHRVLSRRRSGLRHCWCSEPQCSRERATRPVIRSLALSFCCPVVASVDLWMVTANPERACGFLKPAFLTPNVKHVTALGAFKRYGCCWLGSLRQSRTGRCRRGGWRIGGSGSWSQDDFWRSS